MPAPLVMAAMMVGQQLLSNLRKPKPQYQPTNLRGEAPAPAYQPPPAQGGDASSMVMNAFLKRQMGTGAPGGFNAPHTPLQVPQPREYPAWTPAGGF